MKMKKLVALVTASALCLGMSVTAFAAEDNTNPSPDKNSLPWAGWEFSAADNADGTNNPYNLHLKGENLSSSEADFREEFIKKYAEEANLDLSDDAVLNTKAYAEVVKKAEAKAKEEYNIVINTLWNNPTGKENMLKAFEENGYTIPDEFKKEDVQPEVIMAGNLKPVDTNNMPADIKDVKWRLDLNSVQDKDVKAGDTIYVLHYTGEGKWEIMEAIVQSNPQNGNKYVVVQFQNGLSPVGIVKVTSNNELITLNKNGQPSTVIPTPGDNNNGSSSNGSSSNGTSSNGTNGKVTGTTNVTTAKQATVTKIGTSPKTGEF